MSVATQFAPVVLVPERARTAVAGPPVRLATVTTLCPPSAPPAAPPLRLTRRGVLVLALAVAVLGGVLVWLAALSAPGSAPAVPAGGAGAQGVVTVAPGDTLWSIATRVAPDRDPRAEVADLQRLNHLSTVDLTPGQRLQVR